MALEAPSMNLFPQFIPNGDFTRVPLVDTMQEVAVYRTLCKTSNNKADNNEVMFDVWNPRFNYADVFDRFDDLDFPASYEDLIDKPMPVMIMITMVIPLMKLEFEKPSCAFGDNIGLVR
ncbi:hypothetical protein F3Y22_tig00111036pilonHSYRG00010 [Hibiscus syriacus]|uniref:Uncharacterized protein n=1 Tax=Hibiscus syriacus TaxID=106335 RepID=A0A6A2Z5H2_HIBSY|nr:hypothetical protein F3Y22_tig00111036pilonHSYRG00010 [Hibiscus syriacus]